MESVGRTAGHDFRTGLDRVAYAAPTPSDPLLSTTRPSLSERAVPNHLAALFKGNDLNTTLVDSLRPSESTSALVASSTYRDHLASLRDRLQVLRTGYPRQDQAFQNAVGQIDEYHQNSELLDAMRRVLVGG